jgi:hypothetical protein
MGYFDAKITNLVFLSESNLITFIRYYIFGK